MLIKNSTSINHCLLTWDSIKQNKELTINDHENNGQGLISNPTLLYKIDEIPI